MRETESFTQQFSNFGPQGLTVDVTATYEVIESEDGGIIPDAVDIVNVQLAADVEKELIADFSEDEQAMAELYQGISGALQGPR